VNFIGQGSLGKPYVLPAGNGKDCAGVQDLVAVGAKDSGECGLKAYPANNMGSARAMMDLKPSPLTKDTFGTKEFPICWPMPQGSLQEKALDWFRSDGLETKQAQNSHPGQNKTTMPWLLLPPVVVQLLQGRVRVLRFHLNWRSLLENSQGDKNLSRNLTMFPDFQVSQPTLPIL
jgi:hypothetical protein